MKIVGLSFKKGIDFSLECPVEKIMRLPVENAL